MHFCTSLYPLYLTALKEVPLSQAWFREAESLVGTLLATKQCKIRLETQKGGESRGHAFGSNKCKRQILRLLGQVGCSHFLAAKMVTHLVLLLLHLQIGHIHTCLVALLPRAQSQWHEKHSVLCLVYGKVFH